jgi:N-acetyl-anhydromuramoyl-L-alanine amidase
MILLAPSQQPTRLPVNRWQLNSEGWLPAAHRLDSPHYNERPDTSPPTLLVIHAISLPPNQFGGHYIDALFTNTLDATQHPSFEDIAHLKVSAHFLIRRNGEIMQYVSTQQRAWHAGISQWKERQHCNDFSIGIELEGSDHQSFEGLQYPILTQLTRTLWYYYPFEAIVGHQEIAPGRKTDPGPYFEWNHYQDLLFS